MSGSELLFKSLADGVGLSYPDCERANASQSAAMVAVNLIRSARIILKLDPVDTHYSAQYLVDKAGKEDEEGEMDCTVENIGQYMVVTVLSKKEDGQGEMVPRSHHLTVKECLQFAFKKGLPRSEHWSPLGCTFKAPLFASLIPLVPIKGEVIEAKTLDEALELLMQQPVGARLHVFSPEFDRAGEEGIYNGPSYGTSYVGLRDVIIVAVKRIEGKPIVVTVQICYKKKTLFVKVCGRSMILPLNGGDESQTREPSGLLLDFCIPRLSVN